MAMDINRCPLSLDIRSTSSNFNISRSFNSSSSTSSFISSISINSISSTRTSNNNMDPGTRWRIWATSNIRQELTSFLHLPSTPRCSRCRSTPTPKSNLRRIRHTRHTRHKPTLPP